MGLEENRRSQRALEFRSFPLVERNQVSRHRASEICLATRAFARAGVVLGQKNLVSESSGKLQLSWNRRSAYQRSGG
jgi:hypothetical protein